MRPLLLHYHIFKNAGSSFERALQQALGDGLASFDSPSPRGFVSADDLREFAHARPEVRAIISHQAAPPAPAIPDREIFTSILIRDPIARIRSIYAFERGQQSDTPGATKAKELDFKSYVDWRLQTAPAMFCNYQVHFCTRREAARPQPVGVEALNEAIAQLDRLSIVGTVARYDEWLALARKVLATPFPELRLESHRINVTAATQASESAILDQLIADLGESTSHFLLEQNQLDMCLYQIAESILTRRLAEEGVELTLARAYGEALAHRKASAAPPVSPVP